MEGVEIGIYLINQQFNISRAGDRVVYGIPYIGSQAYLRTAGEGVV
jgi:hypothetical protein